MVPLFHPVLVRMKFTILMAEQMKFVVLAVLAIANQSLPNIRSNEARADFSRRGEVHATMRKTVPELVPRVGLGVEPNRREDSWLNGLERKQV